MARYLLNPFVFVDASNLQRMTDSATVELSTPQIETGGGTTNFIKIESQTALNDAVTDAVLVEVPFYVLSDAIMSSAVEDPTLPGLTSFSDATPILSLVLPTPATASETATPTEPFVDEGATLSDVPTVTLV